MEMTKRQKVQIYVNKNKEVITEITSKLARMTLLTVKKEQISKDILS